jgi:hypothetical protein
VYDTVQLSGCVVDVNGARVVGAQVASDGITYTGTSSSTSDASGNFVLPMQRGGQATVVALSGGFLSNTVSVGPYSADTQLSSCLTIGQTGAGVTVKLTWGASPRDLDSHLFAPDGTEVYYSDKGSLVAAPFANLDVDDTSSYGPEVVTLTRLMVGTYRYQVHNYTGYSGGSFTASGARVELNIPGRVTELFAPPTGETSSTDWWTVFELQVDASCNITLTRVGTLASQDSPTPAGSPTYCTP